MQSRTPDDDSGSRHPWEPPYDPAPLSDAMLDERIHWHLAQAHAYRAAWIGASPPARSDRWWAYWSAESRHWQQIATNSAEKGERARQRRQKE